MKTLWIFAAVGLISAAPVPRDLPQPCVKAGQHDTRWNQMQWIYNLADDGSLTASTAVDRDPIYTGWWQWDRKTRRLHLCETKDNWQSWVYYLFDMDKNLAGRCIESATDGEPDETPRSVRWELAVVK